MLFAQERVIAVKKVIVWLVVFLMGVFSNGCAFTGSEPMPVPHAAAGDYEDCGSCHTEGINGAPKTDHPKKKDCLSCHTVAPTEQE